MNVVKKAYHRIFERTIASIQLMRLVPLMTVMLINFSACNESLEDGGLRIGWAQEDVPPELPASMHGQYYERIANEVQSPLKVTACAIESIGGNGVTDQAIMVSVDVVNISRTLQESAGDWDMR